MDKYDHRKIDAKWQARLVPLEIFICPNGIQMDKSSHQHEFTNRD